MISCYAGTALRGFLIHGDTGSAADRDMTVIVGVRGVCILIDRTQRFPRTVGEKRPPAQLMGKALTVIVGVRGVCTLVDRTQRSPRTVGGERPLAQSMGKALTASTVTERYNDY